MIKLKTRIIPYTLHFKQPAGTSRGIYRNHKVWYIAVSDDAGRWGIGECAPLSDLSCDYNNDYEHTLALFCKKLETDGFLHTEPLRPYPSILFGLETAMKQLNQEGFCLWDTPFARGESGIPINGLIWMGDYDFMLRQIEAKIEQGFRCIKLKIGAINFDRELELLRYIRGHYGDEQITLRVDANGAFSAKEAIHKLEKLAELNLHSIEQPIRAGQWEAMAKLAATTPLPIALDEELIGVNRPEDKKRLLETIKPQYIVLKPTLHGGICGAAEWIELARRMNAGWWITSALESNVGLNAIAQWCATFHNPLPQGLGTGALYSNNVEMPLGIKEDCLWFDPQGNYFSIDNIIS
jgi:o-succinylbenzoate synthase